MDGIYCADCGAKLDEAPACSDHRPPCPRCGSLARRFERDVTDQTVLADRGTSTDTITVVRTVGIPTTGQVGNPTVTRGARVIRDQLVVMGRSLWWTQLTKEGGWMVQVVDEAGEVLAVSANYDPIEALASVAEFLLPGHPG